MLIISSPFIVFYYCIAFFLLIFIYIKKIVSYFRLTLVGFYCSFVRLSQFHSRLFRLAVHGSSSETLGLDFSLAFFCDRSVFLLHWSTYKFDRLYSVIVSIALFIYFSNSLAFPLCPGAEWQFWLFLFLTPAYSFALFFALLSLPLRPMHSTRLTATRSYRICTASCVALTYRLYTQRMHKQQRGQSKCWLENMYKARESSNQQTQTELNY